MKYIRDNLFAFVSAVTGVLVLLFGPGVIYRIPLPNPAFFAPFITPIAVALIALGVGYFLGRRRAVVLPKKLPQPAATAGGDRLGAAKWKPQDLTQYVNSYYNFANAPRGRCFFSDCEFLIAEAYSNDANAFLPRVMLVSPIGENVEQSTSIYVGEKNVSEIRFLLNAGNGFANFGDLHGQGATIGAITLNFAGGNFRRIPLKLGGNVRDWYIGNTASIHTLQTENTAKEVWRDPNEQYAIDMLIVRLDGAEAAPLELERITISAQLIREDGRTPFSPTMSRWYGLPAVQVIAITLGVTLTD